MAGTLLPSHAICPHSAVTTTTATASLLLPRHSVYLFTPRAHSTLAPWHETEDARHSSRHPHMSPSNLPRESTLPGAEASNPPYIVCVWARREDRPYDVLV